MEKNKLDVIRSEIDIVDRELARLIEKRMELVSLVAEYKNQNNVTVLDAEREEKVIKNVLSVLINADYANSMKATFDSIMAHSREYQKKKVANSGQRIKRYALIGEHLSHSMSVPVHELFYKKAHLEGSYELLEMPKNELSGILPKLKAKGFSGINVTIPYKTDIMCQLDSLSSEVQRVGAVNTVLFNEKFTGYNTDYSGFGMALSYYKFEPMGKACAVFGSGGASRAVVAFLEDHDAESISIITRDTASARIKYPHLNCIYIEQFNGKGFDLLVNATPVGAAPYEGASPISMNQLDGAGFVMDLLYKPAETLLLKYAKELGIPFANGLYMLVAQGIHAQEIWQGRAFDHHIVNSVYEELKKL